MADIVKYIVEFIKWPCKIDVLYGQNYENGRHFFVE